MSQHGHTHHIYLDNSATTAPYTEVILCMGELMCDTYGNPSSSHSAGRAAKVKVEESRRSISEILRCTPSEVFFTSGGTESDNTVLRSAVEMGVRHIISSPTEHHAITATLKAIEASNAVKLPQNRVRVDYVKINQYGDVDMDDLEHLLCQSSEKTLVSLMHGNNEIGNIYDINAIGSLCHSHGALYHSDAVQTMGHFSFDLKNMDVDFLSASAHKFHGPKGIGLLYCKAGTNLPSFILGGMQERGMRSGTENVPAISGMALAMQINQKHQDEDLVKILSLKKSLIDSLREIKGIRFNGRCTQEDSMPTLVSVTLPIKKDSGMTLLALDMAGVCVSAGSACMAGAWQPSGVITALYGENDPMSDCPTIRFSMCKYNTEEEIDTAVQAVKNIL
ncbi:MAG: cysteine desulfurase family protein [Flavobacteriales bacterium]|nr:cysteine desulfurase family protein [Flavobacteriales bacterium]